MRDMVPIARVQLGDEEIEAAVEVLKSGRLVQGRKTEEFERAFAEKVGVEHAIAVSSGSAALHISYMTAVPEPGEILVPNFSHISTASMVHMAGSRPVFCDVDPETFTLDLEDAGRRLTPRAKAVAPVHLFGVACAIDEITDFARANGLRIIWDTAQAHRTTYNGRDVGGFGDLACYSFYATKNMTTGEGGMITVDDPKLAEQCRLFRSHGQSRKYHHSQLGFNYRMSEMEAAIGLVQLKKIDVLTHRRRENAAYLTRGLANMEELVVQRVPKGVEHSYHQYSVLLRTDALRGSRDEFVEALRQEGIGAAVHYPRPLHEQPALRALVAETPPLPVSQDISQRIVSLPVHPGLTREDLDRVVAAVQAVVRSSAR